MARAWYNPRRRHSYCQMLSPADYDNVAEQRALEKSGFRREGVLRQAGFRGGRWRDGILYALLRNEFNAPSG
jgi:RimJ/RimL family protein N-acetyltransferase